MTPQRWERIKELFGGAMDLEPSDRSAFLKREAGADAEVQREVEALLLRHDTPGAFLDRGLPHLPALEAVLSGHAFAAGELVNGRFRILRFLGQGGMGEVYEAEDVELKTRIAIKTVRAELAQDEGMRERFRQEILLARSVTHPSVCRLFDVGACERPGAPSTLFLTMELLAGETLARRIGRLGRYSTVDALPLVRQMAAALDAAHAAGVVHRDFKAANVILSPAADGTERAVVTDFGLARGLALGTAAGDSSVTPTGATVGTPAYMAPEQIEGKPAGPAADVYAFGVVLYEMVTGRRPYSESSPLALAARKVRDAAPPPGDYVPGLDAGWQSAILECLAIDPGKRFARAGDALRVLESGRWPGFRQLRLPKLRGRRVWIAAALFVLSVCAVALWIWRRPPAVALSGEPARWYGQGVEALHAGAPWRARRLLERVTSVAPAFPLAHVRLAEVYTDLDMGDQAKFEMLKAGEAAPDRSALPRNIRLELDAAEATVLREFTRAASRYAQLADLETGDRKIGPLLDFGRSLERDNQADKAITAYQRAAALDRQNAAAHLRQAVLLGRQGKLTLAAPLFDEAEANYRLTGDFEGIAEVLLQKSAAFRNGRKLADSRSAAAEALSLATTSGNLAQQIRAHFEFAAIAIGEGHLDVSASESAASLDLAHREGLDNLSISGLNDLGSAYLTQYKTEEAADTFRQAMELARRIQNQAGEARASLLLGSTLLRAGAPARALPFIESALQFYRKGGYRAPLTATLTLLADTQISQGLYQPAWEAVRELRSFADSVQDRLQATIAWEREADIQTWQGRYPEAIEVYKGSADSYRSLGQTMRELYAKANRADLLWRLGRDAEAQALLDDVQKGVTPLGDGGKPMAVRVATIRGAEALARRDFAGASEFAAKALSDDPGGSPYRTMQARQIEGLAKVHGRQVSAGKRICDDVLALADRAPHVGLRAEIEIGSAEAALSAGDAVAAGRLARQVLADCERLGEEEMAYRAALFAAAAARRGNVTEISRQADAAVAKHASSLEVLWGKDALAIYQKRPDLIALRQSK